MIISPAMMKVFEECQQKYIYMYIDKISLPQNKYIYEKGKKIHALASYVLKKYDVSKQEKFLNKQEKELWEYLKSTEYFNFTPVQSEYQISLKVDEYWIGGRLDALVKCEDNYYILDYKTGSIPQNPQYDYQTMVYLLCADKILNNYKSLNFVYLDLKNKEEKIIKFSEDLRQEYLEKIKKILFNINLVSKSHSNLSKNNKCPCDYYCICGKSDIKIK